MLYGSYSASFGSGTGKDWISVYDDLIKSGVWAVMPPSARKVYLVMKAFTVEGFYANAGWVDPDHYEDVREVCEDHFDFMPASILDGFGRERPTLANLCGLNDRTYRHAKVWLTDNELMHFYEGDYYTGLAFPHRPNRYAPKVLEAMETKKEKQSEAARRGCTGHAKKALRAIKVRTKQAKERGGDPRLNKIATEKPTNSNL